MNREPELGEALSPNSEDRRWKVCQDCGCEHHLEHREEGLWCSHCIKWVDWRFCRRCMRPLAHEEHLNCRHCVPTDPWAYDHCRLCERVLLDWERNFGALCLHCSYEPKLQPRRVPETHCKRCAGILLDGEQSFCMHCLPGSEGRCDLCGRVCCAWELQKGEHCKFCVVECAEDVLGLDIDFWWR